MQNVIEIILTLDKQLFYWINLSFASHFLDLAMINLTDKHNWYIPGGILWGLLIWKGGKKGRTVALLVIIAITLSDQISSSLLKPSLERFRPCKSLENFRLLVHCGSLYGFPSSHASNIAAIGTLFMIAYKRWIPFWGILIFLIGISRVYVGVHFPLDVFCGWLLGGAISLFLVWVINSQKFESYLSLKPD